MITVSDIWDETEELVSELASVGHKAICICVILTWWVDPRGTQGGPKGPSLCHDTGHKHDLVLKIISDYLVQRD